MFVSTMSFALHGEIAIEYMHYSRRPYSFHLVSPVHPSVIDVRDNVPLDEVGSLLDKGKRPPRPPIRAAALQHSHCVAHELLEPKLRHVYRVHFLQNSVRRGRVLVYRAYEPLVKGKHRPWASFSPFFIIFYISLAAADGARVVHVVPLCVAYVTERVSACERVGGELIAYAAVHALSALIRSCLSLLGIHTPFGHTGNNSSTCSFLSPSR